MKNSQKNFSVPLLLAIMQLVLIGGGLYLYKSLARTPCSPRQNCLQTKKVEIPALVDNKIQQSDQVKQQTNNQNNAKILNSVECEKYVDPISTKINQYNALQKPEFKNSDNTGENTQYDLYKNNNLLKEVFYSPKINSCLYLESRRTLVKFGVDAKPDVGDWTIAYETYYLIDALTSKEIPFYKGMFFIQIISRGMQFHLEKDVGDALSEYR